MTLFTFVLLAAGTAISYIFYSNLLIGFLISVAFLAIYLPITIHTSTSQVIQMSGAKLADEAKYSDLHNIVEELAIAARLPKPDLYIISDSAPNAFATGTTPEKSAIALTTGLVDMLNREELSGVIAHELAHIRNYDVRLMTICIGLVSIVIIASDIVMRMIFYGGGSRNRKTHPAILIIALLFIVLSPLVVQMVRLAVSRNREYLADATAVELTRNPIGLKQALLKVSKYPKEVDQAKAATASMYIVPPLRNKRKGKRSLVATHPPIESRIERIDQM